MNLCSIINSNKKSILVPNDTERYAKCTIKSNLKRFIVVKKLIGSQKGVYAAKMEGEQ